MIDLKLIGARADIELVVSQIAAMFAPGIGLIWSLEAVQMFRFDTVALSVLFAPAREGVTDGETVILPATPEGAHIRVSYHGMPQEGDHLAAIAALLPADGESVGAVTRLDDGELSAVWS